MTPIAFIVILKAMFRGEKHRTDNVIRKNLRWHRLFSLCLLFLVSLTLPMAGVMAQQGRVSILDANPRELSIDIFTQLKRGTDPGAIAARLGLLIPIYRFTCPRVTDYQVYEAMSNIYVLKVKCSGQPYYGVTVAANGYLAVYGGNGMIQPFDRREGLVLSFGVDGAVIATSRKTTREAIKEAVEQMSSDATGFDPAVFALLLIGLFALTGTGAIVWIRAVRRRATAYQRNPKLKLKRPLDRVEIAAGLSMSSDLKNQLQGESEIIARHVYKHPAGFFMSRGNKGRRRLFDTAFGAKLYARFNMRLFELEVKEAEKRLLTWSESRPAS